MSLRRLPHPPAVGPEEERIRQRFWIAKDAGDPTVHWVPGNLNQHLADLAETAVCGTILSIPIWGRNKGARANWTHTAGEDLWPFVTCRGCIAWGMQQWAREEDLDANPF